MTEDIEKLRTAFDNLLSLTDEPRQALVLRRAIALVLDAEPARPLALRSPTVTATDRVAWEETRRRARAVLELGGLSQAACAREIGLPVSTVEKALSPNGGAPGALVAQKIADWLTAREQPAIASAPVVNGAAASALRLSEAQRDRLSGYLSFGDKEVRNLLGVTKETAEKALHGQPLADEIVARIAAALGASGNGAAE